MELVGEVVAVPVVVVVGIKGRNRVDVVVSRGGKVLDGVLGKGPNKATATNNDNSPQAPQAPRDSNHMLSHQFSVLFSSTDDAGTTQRHTHDKHAIVKNTASGTSTPLPLFHIQLFHI